MPQMAHELCISIAYLLTCRPKSVNNQVLKLNCRLTLMLEILDNKSYSYIYFTVSLLFPEKHADICDIAAVYIG